MANNPITRARKQLGAFFQARREELGHDVETVAVHLGITANTMRGVETGRFAWDIDLHLRICQVLEIKPYFSTINPPDTEDYRLRAEDDPERYHGYYITENILLYPDQLAITKLTHPRLYLRFNYRDSFFSSYEDWKANHTELQWLDPDDKPTDPEEIDEVLTDCWNFLALTEREEERQPDERGEEKYFDDENEDED